MEKEEEMAKHHLNKEIQNVIQQDQKNNKIRAEIHEEEQGIEQADSRIRILDKKIEALKEYLENQEVGAEEAKVLEMEIDALKNGIDDTKKNHQKKMKALERKRL